jgi:hypothetical protein
MKILLCYDGSSDAKAAVRAAGALFDGSTTIVFTVWEDLSQRRRPGGIWSGGRVA